MDIKLGLVVAATVGSLGCATSGMGPGQPAVAGVDSDGIPTSWAPGTVTGAAACHATGRAKVVARRVFAPGGVEASEKDGSFSVRFATKASRCVVADLLSTSDGPHPASCPSPGAHSTARADSSDGTLLAWESHDDVESQIKLGVVTYDAPHAFFGVGIEGKRQVVERTFYAPGENRAGEMAPELAPIGHDRFLLAWVEGGVEGHELRAQAVTGWGDALGPSMVLSPPEASVIGRPSVVVEPTGDGLVTYVASMGDEFDVLATPIACATN
ncbi:MAG: hypothetical protein ACLP1X_11620 [Polyangiaceae bacterium]|jgi:hypothetical protein